MLKYLKKIVFLSCNKKHLSSCQIYVNEPMTMSVNSGSSSLVEYGGEVKITRIAKPEHLRPNLIRIKMAI